MLYTPTVCSIDQRDIADGMATLSNGVEPSFDIPKYCKAGVVTKEGKDFEIEVQMVPVPEPGMAMCHHSSPLS